MKTNRLATSRACWLTLVLLCFSHAPLWADQFGLFTYQVVGATVEITRYPQHEIGPVAIPAVIAGMTRTSTMTPTATA